MSVHRKRAFSLGDVLIVLVVIALLFALFLRGADRFRRASDRVECAKNLRDIGQAMLVYASGNRGGYPQTVYHADVAVTQYTGSAADDPFGAGGPDPNDVTAAMFLLIRNQELKPEQFICPATITLLVVPRWTATGIVCVTIG